MYKFTVDYLIGAHREFWTLILYAAINCVTCFKEMISKNQYYNYYDNFGLILSDLMYMYEIELINLLLLSY